MKKRVKYLLVLSFIMLFALCTKSQARITTNDPTVSSEGTVTITISSQEKVASGAIDISSNGGLTFVSASASGGLANGTSVAFALAENKTSGIATYTFKAPKVAETKTFKIVFSSSDMADVDGKAVASSSATATVTVKGSSTNNGNNNNGGNSSGGNTTTPTTTPTFTNKNEKVYITDSANVRSSCSTQNSSNIIGSVKKGDSVTRTGLATKSVGGVLWSRISFNGRTAYVTSGVLTTTKPVESEKPDEKDNNDDKQDDEKNDDKKSDNKNLKSLTVTPTGLSPAFSSGTTEYTMTIGSDIDKIDVNAVTEDTKANVEVSGNTNLEIGTNKIKITVTAEDNSTKVYNITVTKESTVQLKLKELLIEGMPLEPEFDSNIYEYTLNLDKNNISELNITATPNQKEADIEILGNTDLKPGTNVVTVLLKSADGEETATYQITVNLPKVEEVAKTEDNKELYKYIAIGVGGVIVVIIISVIVINHRKNRFYEEEEDDEPVEGIKGDFGMDRTEKKVQVEELLELEEEDLPKSLRKEKEESKENEKEIDSEEKEQETDRSKKIDELYSMDDINNDFGEKKKKGKHF